MEQQEFTLPTLHELAIIIKSKQEKLEHLLTPRPHDVCMCEYCNSGRMREKFEAIAMAMNEKVTGEIIQLTDRAEQIVGESESCPVTESGGKKAVFTGVGTFLFQKKPVSVDSSAYDKMDDNAKHGCRLAYPDGFQENVTYSPKKAQIKEWLKDGDDIQGFSLSAESYTFKFKF